jgi:hypothetical protein
MRTLSLQELTSVAGGTFCFFKLPKKPTCIKLPKPTKGCKPKPTCPTTTPDPVDPGPGTGEG